MTLRENYKIENDGIWIAKSELEEWRKHYEELVGKHSNFYDMWLNGTDTFKLPYYIGKADVLTDLLKMFEPQEVE